MKYRSTGTSRTATTASSVSAYVTAMASPCTRSPCRQCGWRRSMLTSSRYQIVYPAPTRADSADVPRDIGSLVTAVERSAMYGQGTLATRPTSTAGTPGIQGRFYMATDQTPMVLYYDYGTGWASVGSISAGSIGTARLADDSVTGGPAGAGVKLKQLTVTHDNIAAG